MTSPATHVLIKIIPVTPGSKGWVGQADAPDVPDVPAMLALETGELQKFSGPAVGLVDGVQLVLIAVDGSTLELQGHGGETDPLGFLRIASHAIASAHALLQYGES